MADDPILPLLSDLPDTAVFAVIDGAQADGLPGLLAHLRLDARPLYFDVADGRGHAAGPHLVACPDARAVADLRAHLPATAVVWWVWPEEEAAPSAPAIYRHLRGLGRVEIPAGHPGPTPPGASVEPVLFRHADPRVMAEVLPVLTPAQQARLYGRAAAIVIDTPARGLRIARIPADLPPPAPGMLRLTAGQMADLAEVRQEPRDAAILDYLNLHAGDEINRMSQAERVDLVRAVQQRARQLGVVTDAGVLKLAFLAAVTGGHILNSPELQAAVAGSGLSPDDTVDATMRVLPDLLRGLGE